MSEEVFFSCLVCGPTPRKRAKQDVDIQNAQQRSYTRSSGANEDDKEVRDGKVANKKGRQGSLLVPCCST